MATTRCCICGTWMLTAARTDENAVCEDCRPNLAGSVDQRLEPESCQVPEELYALLLGQDAANETDAQRAPQDVG